MTDGFIGNDDQILAAVKEKVGNARLFSFGVGSSPNRSLLERMAELGRGTAQYIRQDQPPQPVIKDMLSRISKPYLTDVEIDWGGLAVSDVYPDPVPDLFSAQPLILFARYDSPGEATVTLRGSTSGESYEEGVRISLPEWDADNGSLASVWAREKIKYLMLEQVAGRVASIEEEVTNLALEYNLMSQYTSFVAVDEVLPEGSDTTLPKTIAIPVPMPEGVSFTGVFGPPSGHPGDYVTGAVAAKEMAESHAKFYRPPVMGRRFRGRVEMAQRSAGTRALSLRSSAKAPAFAGTPAPVLGDYAGPAADADREGMAILSPLADKEHNKYLQEAYQSLAKKDRELYSTLNQVYRGGKVEERKANQALGKLLASKEEGEVAVGLDLMAALAHQKVKINEEFVANARNLATKGKNPYVRYKAILALSAHKGPVPLDILKTTAKDKDATVRVATAYTLADERLGPEAELLIIKLVGDEDQRVAALAIKAGTEMRKIDSLIPALGDILLKADVNSKYLAVLEAGVGLCRLAEAVPAERARIQRLFVQALGKDYPVSVGEEKLNLKKAITLVALKTLSGYKEEDAYQTILKLASDPDKDVQTLAISVLAGYKKAASYLLTDVLSKGQLLDRPELLATVVQHLREYKSGDDFYEVARRLLEEKKVGAGSHAILRVALVEAVLDRGRTQDMEYLTSLLRTDSNWKVRRAILARLASLKKEKILDTAMKALEDPHPIIRRLALAEAIAATADKDKRVAYLDKIASNPAPAICDEILVAEGLSPDLSLRPRGELWTILRTRGVKL
jgi:HEAT repeat protein